MIGAGEPALPGISIGHNGTIAFGLTIFTIDQEDLYVYELNPADRTQYRYKDGWEAMRVMSETDRGQGRRRAERASSPSPATARSSTWTPKSGAPTPCAPAGSNPA